MSKQASILYDRFCFLERAADRPLSLYERITFLDAIFPPQVSTAAVLAKPESTALPSQRSKISALKMANGTRSGWTACRSKREKKEGTQVAVNKKKNVHLANPRKSGRFQQNKENWALLAGPRKQGASRQSQKTGCLSQIRSDVGWEYARNVSSVRDSGKYP